jgi:hypothetical protein
MSVVPKSEVPQIYGHVIHPDKLVVTALLEIARKLRSLNRRVTVDELSLYSAEAVPSTVGN